MIAYQEFAQIYDELMNDVDYRKWYNYVKSIFSTHNYNPKNILEMACGTGNFTKYLCEDGYDITCFDLSEDMLSIAFEKLKDYKNVTILKQNMIDFKINKKFDAILSICDGINYILEDEDIERVFKNVYSHLSENGIFIFDVSSYYKISNILGNNTFVFDNDNVFYVWENSFDVEKSLCQLYLTFFVRENEKYIRFDENHIQRGYKIDEITKFLKKAGFKDIKVYDGLTNNLPNEECERINFVALK